MKSTRARSRDSPIGAPSRKAEDLALPSRSVFKESVTLCRQLDHDYPRMTLLYTLIGEFSTTRLAYR